MKAHYLGLFTIVGLSFAVSGNGIEAGALLDGFTHVRLRVVKDELDVMVVENAKEKSQ